MEVDFKRVGATSRLDEGKSKDIDIFGKLHSDFAAGRFPWVGRCEDFILGYLTFASVLHARVKKSVSKPVGSFVIGNTSSGKSQFLEALSLLLPPEHVINLTTASAKSLIYNCRANSYYLNGKVVFVEELSGLKNPEIQYLLRVLLTKGYARHTTVLSGQAEDIDIHGAISLQSTGLSTDALRDDTMNRLVIFKSDHSQARTHAVIENIKGRYSQVGIERDDDFSDYHDFFDSLKAYTVVIPYIDKITFDTSKTETRRSSKLFMDLLATVALVNQHKREVKREAGYLISEPEDLAILSEVTEQVSEPRGHKLSPCQTAVVDVIDRFPNKQRFTYQEILGHGPADVEGHLYQLTSVKKAVLGLLDMGVVEVYKNGKPVIYSVKKQGPNNAFGMSCKF